MATYQLFDKIVFYTSLKMQLQIFSSIAGKRLKIKNLIGHYTHMYPYPNCLWSLITADAVVCVQTLSSVGRKKDQKLLEGTPDFPSPIVYKGHFHGRT